MAKIKQHAQSFQFTELSAVGAELINEFERHHSKMCKFSPVPTQRTVEWTTPEEREMLMRLAKQVEVQDPE